MRITIVLAALVLTATIYASHCNFVFAESDSVFAQATSSADVNLNDLDSLDETGAIEVGESLIHPASPLYFLKAIREKIEMAISTTRQSRAILEVEFAQRRLRETRALIKIKRNDLIPPTLEKYKIHVQNVRDLGSFDEELAVTVGEAIARHLDVLQRVYDQVGEPRAKAAIRAAIEKAEEHNMNLLEKLTLVNQQMLIRKIAMRQALACKFFEREASSSALNDTERAFMKDRVNKCKTNIRENLNDELMDIKNKKMMKMEYRETTPTSVTQ